MTAKTFCNKKFRHFLGSLVRRNLALAVLIFFIGFVCMPLQFFFTALSPDSLNPAYSAAATLGAGGLYTVSSIFLMPLLWVACAAVAALMQTAYMQNRRAVDVYHSLPLTRPQLLCANYLAAFFTVAAPMALNYLITLFLSFVRCARFASEVFLPAAALFGFALWLVSLAGMLSVAFLVSTQTGSVFDTLVFTGVLLVSPLFLALMHTVMCGAFLYGYSGGINLFVLLQLSPLTLGSMDLLSEFVSLNGHQAASWQSCLLWAAAAIGLLAAACRLYVRRPSERAESPSRTGLLALIIRVAAMLILCPVGGYVFAFSASDTPTLWLVLLGTVLCGVLGFMILEAILNRGTKGLLKSLPLGVCLTALVTGYMAALCTGGLGFESRLPRAENIESVTVNYRGQFDYVDQCHFESEQHYIAYSGNTTLSSPEAIEAVLQLQADAVADHRERGQLTTGYYSGSMSSKTLFITYTLKSGRSIQRTYNTVWLTPVIEQDYRRLADCAELSRNCSPLQNTTADDYVSISVTGANALQTDSISSTESINALLAALHSDSNRLGITGMLDDHARVVAVLQLYTKTPPTTSQENFFGSYSLQLTESYADSIACLQSLGFEFVLKNETPALSRVYLFTSPYYAPYYTIEHTGHFLVPALSQAELKDYVTGESFYDSISLTSAECDLSALFSLGKLRGKETQALVWMIFEAEDGTLSLPMYASESDLRAAGYGDIADVLLTESN